jgi:hypothetical protein
VRVRPLEVMDDLDLDLVQAKVGQLRNWEVEFQDTRLSDAPYVTLIMKLPEINLQVLTQLKTTFADFGRMRAQLWIEQGVEVPISTIQIADLERASQKF